MAINRGQRVKEDPEEHAGLEETLLNSEGNVNLYIAVKCFVILCAINKFNEPRAHDSDHVRDFQRASNVCGHPGCALPVCIWPHHWHRDGFWRRSVSHSANLRRLCPASRHPA